MNSKFNLIYTDITQEEALGSNVFILVSRNLTLMYL